VRRQYAGGAKPTTLASSLGGSNSDLVISGTDFSNYPDGSVGPFYIVIDRGTVSEEKILCGSRTGNTINVYNVGLTNGRGADGTSVVAHSSGGTVEHVFTAVDADEANLHVNSTSNVHGVTGSLAGVTSVQTLTNKTLTSPVLNSPDINGGTISGATIATSTFSGGITATSVSITGSQTLADYRARNAYASTAAPTAGTGNDGDLWVQYEE
jgi:hypothetical protein